MMNGTQIETDKTSNYIIVNEDHYCEGHGDEWSVLYTNSF